MKLCNNTIVRGGKGTDKKKKSTSEIPRGEHRTKQGCQVLGEGLETAQ